MLLYILIFCCMFVPVELIPGLKVELCQQLQIGQLQMVGNEELQGEK